MITTPAALRALRSTVGDDAFIGSASDALAAYADPYAFTDEAADARAADAPAADARAADAPAADAPAAVVLPACVDDVRAILRVATHHHVPLWTVSRGRNLGYGGAAARLPGSVILDLHRMNAVLDVDDTLAYALVEPGVSFFDLHRHLRAGDHPLWTSVPDLGGGSIIGNALERGFGYTPYGRHADTACGLEIVLADGDVVRTGMGAVTGSTAWQAYNGGYGPSVAGLMHQSNLGVVTKMGLWLMPRPQVAASCTVTVAQQHDLAALVDTLRPLLLDQTIQSTVMVGNALAVASMISPRSRWYDGPGPMPPSTVGAVADDLGIGWWNAKFGLYGPDLLVQARLHVVRQAVAGIPGADLVVRTYPGDVPADQVHPADRAQLGIPSGDLIRMAAWRGGEPAHTDFSLVCPTTGRHAQDQADLIGTRVQQAGFDYAGGFTLFGRHGIALALLSFDRADAAQRAAIRRLFPTLIRDAAAAGYAPYRSHLAHMDLVADRYDVNDHAQRRLHRTLKTALDPHGVLSPGKQGIWPAGVGGCDPVTAA